MTTIFIRNLPYKVDDSQLKESCGVFGFVSEAFVVKNKEGVSRGFGFAKYTTRNDAIRAIKELKVIADRPVFVNLAKPKANESSGGIEDVAKDSPTDAKISFRNQKKEDTMKVVVVSGASVPKIQKLFENVDWVQDTKAQSDDSVHITVTDKKYSRFALKRARRLGGQVTATLLSRVIRQQRLAERKDEVEGGSQSDFDDDSGPVFSEDEKRKLIVRNLPFEFSEEDLRAIFEECGEITFLKLPAEKSSSTCRGFGFVEFSSATEAQAALEKKNGTEVMGRQIVVDFAIHKFDYDKTGAKIETAEEEAKKNELKAKKKKKKLKRKSQDEDVPVNTKEISGQTPQDNDVKPAKRASSKSSSLFVRNVPFEFTEDELREVFGAYGDVYSCLIVTDPNTERSKGSAFIQFDDEHTTKACLDASNTENGIVVSGRKLLVCKAVSRDDAAKLNSKQSETVSEKVSDRNKTLARYGVIKPGTEQAEGISKPDLVRRMRILAAKKLKMKNPNIFVSETRLCVHNLPGRIKDTDLMQTVISLTSLPQSAITECRVMQHNKPKAGSEKTRSLGFAFVTFTEHKQALECLNKLNNSTVFGELKRPIVEFSLENRNAVRLKQKRLEKNKTTVSNDAPTEKQTKRKLARLKRKKKLKLKKLAKEETAGTKEETKNCTSKTSVSKKDGKMPASPRKRKRSKKKQEIKDEFDKVVEEHKRRKTM